MQRHAFVTGGSGGIGSAICRMLAAQGNTVTVADLDEVGAKELAAELGGLAVALDVTDGTSIKTAVAQAVAANGPVQILVNCAGWERTTALTDMDDEHITRIIDINLTGLIRITREVVAPMVATGWGRIVNVSLDAARSGAATYTVYSAAKAGVNSFTKSLAHEVGYSGVTVNAMSPGAIDTPLLRSSQGENVEFVLDYLKDNIPLGRIGTPDEAAAIVAFFASDAASYVTGQVLSVNGGLSR